MGIQMQIFMRARRGIIDEIERKKLLESNLTIASDNYLNANNDVVRIASAYYINFENKVIYSSLFFFFWNRDNPRNFSASAENSPNTSE